MLLPNKLNHVSRIAAELVELEVETLKGNYKPYGAHATVIYETLWNFGLMKSGTGELTKLGEQVKEYYESR